MVKNAPQTAANLDFLANNVYDNANGRVDASETVEEPTRARPAALDRKDYMDVKLTIIGDGKEYFSRVVNLPCVIGRGKQSDVTIIHPLVSRRHCEIYEENGAVMTRDLGSLNGTYFHKARIGRGVAVPFGDHFTIGKLKFKIDPASDSSSVVAPNRESAPVEKPESKKAATPQPAAPTQKREYDDQAYSLSLPKTNSDESDSSVLNLDEYLKE